MSEDLEAISRVQSANDIENESNDAYNIFTQMEELYDKLKLLDHENEFIKQNKLRPLNRHYFALQTNPGEQFYAFSLLAAWLIKKCGKIIDPPQEYDDPNSTIAVIMDAARNLGIPVDFSPIKLKQGYGKFVTLLLNQLADRVLQNMKFTFKKPLPPVEVADEETVIEDDSELLLERIEEEMMADDAGSEEDEDLFLNVDDLNKLNFHTQKPDEIIQTNITNEEWQLEVERVLPSLKLTIKTESRDWRGHLEQIKNYRTIIGDAMKSVKPQLDKLSKDISEIMEKITSREKFLNSNLDSLLNEYRTARDQFFKINAHYQELNTGVTERQRKLTRISEELETLKQEMEERGTVMTDGTPLINIKKALVVLKEDVANMNVQIGILQHDILHSKLQEKLLMRQKLHSQPTKDPICCMTCSDKTLLIGRRSGTIQRYTLPQVALIQRFALSTRPQSIAINNNSTKFSVIDCTGALSLITLHKEIADKYNMGKEDNAQIERRDVWDMKWASDNPQYLAIMEKTRMYVLKDGQPEEPIASSAYIAHFENLEIKGVLLDEVITSPDNLSMDNVVNFEVKSLRDTRELLQKVGIQEATSFIEKNPHPRLWRLLAEAALQNLDLSTAEMAYVKRNDYGGIQLIKKLSNIQNTQLKKATIAAYFNDFEEAEELYLKADRRDLAIAQREKLGDWFRVVELMRTASVTSDSQLNKAWDNIGDYFLERNKWEAAKEYYLKASNYDKLITCYQYMEDYEALESCISLLPEKSPLLEKIGEIFLNTGMCSQSVDAYLKYGAIQFAAEVCVKLNQWDLALHLANQFPANVHVQQLFENHVNELLKKGKILDTIQLYRKAERYLDAAELLFELGNEQKEKSSPSLMKKIYVLVGLLVEDYLTLKKISKAKSEGGRSKALSTIDVDNVRNIKLLDNPWYYAEAYHLLILSQTLVMNGDLERALKVAVRLRNYDDILEPLQIYSIIATCAISCRAFETASKAFTELESIPTDRHKEYEAMALHLFSKNEPKDSADKFTKCVNCSKTNSLWDSKCSQCGTQAIMCMATGQIIEIISDGKQCAVCKHFTLSTQIMTLNSCPLCHFPSKM